MLSLSIFFIIQGLIVVWVLFRIYDVYQISLASKREIFIDSYDFPETITIKVIEKYPHLSKEQAELVIKGLREYFHVCNVAAGSMVSMPSQVVDVAWHEFILFTRMYEEFCGKAINRFLHHTPAEAMLTPRKSTVGIKKAWKISCHREKLSPSGSNKLPILFALDSQLKISDGFKYSLNCTNQNNGTYCAGHINSGAYIDAGGISDSFGDGGCISDSSGGNGGCISDSSGGGSSCGGGGSSCSGSSD